VVEALIETATELVAGGFLGGGLLGEEIDDGLHGLGLGGEGGFEGGEGGGGGGGG
jgi:hypothetical protein